MHTCRVVVLIVLVAIVPSCRLPLGSAPEAGSRRLPVVSTPQRRAWSNPRAQDQPLATEPDAKRRAATAVRPPAESADPNGPVTLASHETHSAHRLAPLVTLTLDQALEASLQRNPDLVVLRAGQDVAHAAYHVAERYPWNPYLQVQILPYTRERNGDFAAVSDYILLMQTLELAHQQRHREASAASAWSQARWNVVQAELATVARTESLYFTVLYQRDLRDLAQRTAQLQEDFLAIVQRRYEATLSTPADVTTARVATRQRGKQAALAEANYQTALLALKRQLNLPADELLALDGGLRHFQWQPLAERAAGDSDAAAADDVWLPGTADMVVLAAQQRPDVLAAAAAVQAASANLRLARANTRPNLNMGPIYEHDEAGTILAGVRSQMDLPVWNNGHPLVQQREVELRQQRLKFEQQERRAVVEAQTALERYLRARQLVESQRRQLAEARPDDLQVLQRQFEAGQANILSVFAVQNALLQEQLSYLDLLNELAQAASDLTLAAGLAPARIVIQPSEAEPSGDVLPVPRPGRPPETEPTPRSLRE